MTKLWVLLLFTNSFVAMELMNFTEESLYLEPLEPAQFYTLLAELNEPEDKTLDQANINRDNQPKELVEALPVALAKPECIYCKENFSSKKQLQYHYQQDHPETKPFVCHCEKAYLHEKHLSQHVRQKHHSNTYDCAHCSEKFPSYKDFQNHLKLIHPKPKSAAIKPKLLKKIKKFPCTDCTKKFKTNKELVLHIARIHKPVYDQNCSFPNCSETFSTKATLDLHILRNHRGVQFECEHCDNVKFSLQGDLNRHYLQVHKIKNPQLLANFFHNYINQKLS